MHQICLFQGISRIAIINNVKTKTVLDLAETASHSIQINKKVAASLIVRSPHLQKHYEQEESALYQKIWGWLSVACIVYQKSGYLCRSENQQLRQCITGLCDKQIAIENWLPQSPDISTIRIWVGNFGRFYKKKWQELRKALFYWVCSLSMPIGLKSFSFNRRNAKYWSSLSSLKPLVDLRE